MTYFSFRVEIESSSRLLNILNDLLRILSKFLSSFVALISVVGVQLYIFRTAKLVFNSNC